MEALKVRKSVILILATFFIAITTYATSEKVYADDVSGRALEKEMREMIEQGILKGYEDGSIRPEEKVTRGQFAAFISRALTLPNGTAGFKDVPPSLKLSTEINKVKQAGLMEGYDDNTFKPDEYITREQVTLTLENVLTYSQMELKEKRMSFTDQDDFVSSGGVRAVFYATHYGIISGYPNPDGTLRFEPKSPATREHAAAFIARFLKAKEGTPEQPEQPEQPEEPEEPVEPEKPTPPLTNDYQLAKIQNGKLVKDSKTYPKYLDAANLFNNNGYDAMYHGDELIRVKSGIAYGNNKTSTGAKENTIVYFDENFTKQATYIEQGREMRYINSNDKFVRVQVGATIGYVKHSQVDLMPLALVTKRDYYSVTNSGVLVHNLYNYMSKLSSSYTLGPAPKFLSQGKVYHSNDGVHFMDEKGQILGANFPYFQFLSARTVTNYSGDELETFIMKKLKEREVLNPSKYKDASKKSKLIGMGKHFKALEKEKRINALLILSLAIHESDFGMSETAQQCNNLFGLYKIDSLTKVCPDKGKFTSPELSALTLADTFLNPNYINPASGLGRNLGAAFGNKTTGFNVNYASDPTWGAKAGAHMYENDKALGGRDLYAYTKFAFTKYEIPTRVRTSPDASTRANILFEYKARNVGIYNEYKEGMSYPLGYPLVIVETVDGADGHKWYKVISDLQSTEYGYVRSDVVNVVTYPAK